MNDLIFCNALHPSLLSAHAAHAMSCVHAESMPVLFARHEPIQLWKACLQRLQSMKELKTTIKATLKMSRGHTDINDLI